MEKQIEHLYFPNLNALRAIAAFMVIVFHIELVKSEYNISNIKSIVTMGGDLGVILFFVLSGFLITFLLLSEKKNFGTISLKDFYLRRILRIWPLYLFIVTACLFIFPHLPFLEEPIYANILSRPFQVVFYYLFMANVLTGFMSHVNFGRPLWSVSVEEQFYLIWPLLIKFSKNILRTMLFIFLFYWFIKLSLIILKTQYVKHIIEISFIENIATVWDYTPFDSLSIGSVAAYLLFNKHYILNFLFKKKTQIMVFIVAPVFIYLFRVHFIIRGITTSVDINNTVYGIIFAVAILNLSSNPGCIISLENKLSRFLGKISYGLYMYHWVVIVLVINTMNHFVFKGYNQGFLYHLSIYVLTFALTILVAGISYYFLELRFLKLKQKYSKMISGDFVKK